MSCVLLKLDYSKNINDLFYDDQRVFSIFNFLLRRKNEFLFFE